MLPAWLRGLTTDSEGAQTPGSVNKTTRIPWRRRCQPSQGLQRVPPPNPTPTPLPVGGLAQPLLRGRGHTELLLGQMLLASSEAKVFHSALMWRR